MIKAILRYTDCLQDGRKVFTVLVKDHDHLSCLLHELNTSCTYKVRLVKYYIV